MDDVPLLVGGHGLIRPEVERLMARCALAPRVVSGSTVSASVQKAVLWTVACYEGAPISLRAVGLYSGVVDQTAARALTALQINGAIVQRATRGGEASIYDVDAGALARNQADEPPVMGRR